MLEMILPFFNSSHDVQTAKTTAYALGNDGVRIFAQARIMQDVLNVHELP